MKTLGYYNGKYDEIDKIMIPMSDRSHWFGDGVYDATCARNYKIMAIDEHVDRFFNSARLLDINLGFTKEYLKNLLNELVQKLDDDELYIGKLLVAVMGLEVIIMIKSKKLIYG